MLAFSVSLPIRFSGALSASRVTRPMVRRPQGGRHASAAIGAGVRACLDASSDVSPEIVRKTAKMASLELSEDEVEPLTERFGKIIDIFNTMKEVDVEGVEAMTSPFDSQNVLREDKAVMYGDV